MLSVDGFKGGNYRLLAYGCVIFGKKICRQILTTFVDYATITNIHKKEKIDKHTKNYDKKYWR